MINQFALNKALLDKLNSITADSIAVHGSSFTPNVDEDYIAEKEVPTTIEGRLNENTVTQRGFYQVTICTPIAKKKFYHFGLVDSILPQFTIGLTSGIEFNGQKVSIGTVTPSGMFSDDTHLKTALTINYTVIA